MIRISHVSKSFGSQVVLDDVSLIIPDGHTTAIVGPSGVGKSVLLKLIMGIFQPDQGEIFISDRNITAARTEDEKNEIRSSLGVMFQSAALFDSLTVFENVAFALQERTKLTNREINKQTLAMLEALDLGTYAKLLPQQISLGVRKCVAMARCLVTKPEIILFDEPNTGLDPQVGQEVYDLIKRCRERWGFTGVIISHELPEVFQVSDRVAMLMKGKIIFEGTSEEYAADPDAAVQQFLYGRLDGPIQIQ